MIDETYRFDPNDIRATSSLAWLSYLWLLFLVPMLVNQNSPYTKFHVNQGIVFLMLSIVANIIGAIALIIPILGGLISTLINLGLLAIAVIGIINACQGKAKRLPIIGNIEIYK